MFRKLLFLFIALFFGAKIFAQSAGISGTVKDTSSKAGVQNAVVALLSPGDSVLKAFTRVHEDGSFAIQNLVPGKYILTVSHPAFADYVDDIDILTPDQKAGAIALTSKSKLLEAVILKSGNPIKLRGDTTVYTADSFKVSANANVEELLKKMPGIQVDKNGQIKAMGETVEKVLVDGEEFFGDDPGMAVKNLRADAVKEVQVFDKKSDQSVFTGIDDGKTQKTINLKLKDDRKHGYFGKVDLAGGPIKTLDPRYNSNLLYSSFKGKRKISGFLLNGNTGQDGLNWQDEQKYGGDNDNVSMSMDDDGAMMFVNRGGSSDQEPYVDPQNGFITNTNAGLQYSNKFNNDKTSVNLSPKFNSQVYNNDVQTFSQTLLPGDSVLNSFSDATSHVNRHNVKIRGIYDVKIDSANTLKLTAGSNFYHTSSNSNTTGNSTNGEGNLLSDYQRFFSTGNDKTALSGNAIFKHKFKKQRRTFSLTADWKTINTDGVNFQRSANNDYVNGFTQNIDQKTDFNTSSATLQSQLIYTEPLSKKYSLELGYRVGINHGTNDQVSYSKSPAGKYENTIDSLSNNFRQNIFEHAPSAKINYNYKKLKVNVGAGVSFSDFQLKDLSNGNIYNRNYTNFSPSANLTYTYKANHNLRINYSGTTVQPTIDQLQPLKKNDDYFNQYLGNPALRNSFRHNLSVNHGTYNFLKDLWTYESVNLTLTENDIVNSRTVYNNGQTVNIPVNTNGNMYLNFWTGAGYKIKKADIRVGLFPHGSLSRTSGYLNSVKTFSKDANVGTSASISKSKDKKYDVSLESDFGYTSDKTSQSNTVIHYNSNTLRANATVYYKKVWSLNGSYELYTRQKTEQSPAFNNGLFNARLQRTFRKDEYTLYISAHDLLNQNTGVDRNFFNSVYTETHNERLKRYFMAGFAWNFKNKAAAAKK